MIWGLAAANFRPQMQSAGWTAGATR